MRTLSRHILRALLILLGVSVLILAGAHLFTARSQWARAIAWMDSDLDDHQRFPERVVANAARFDFRQPPAATYRHYARGARSTSPSSGGCS